MIININDLYYNCKVLQVLPEGNIFVSYLIFLYLNKIVVFVILERI